MGRKAVKRRIVIIIAAAAALLCLLLPGFWNALRVVRYEVATEGVKEPVRIALVTDLHSCAYGREEKDLLDAVDGEAPDLVLLGGDIFDDVLPDDNAETFLRGISGRYPAWYVTGNHEYWSGEAAFARKMAILGDCGIALLRGETKIISIKGTRIALSGADDPVAWAYEWAAGGRKDGGYKEQVRRLAREAGDADVKLLLTHRPEQEELYAECGFDIVLAGHAHGGQWRIPGILNGLYAPNQGFFPKYAGGMYDVDGTVMIVSRGLARESTRVPRFYNRPELAVVDLTPADKG